MKRGKKPKVRQKKELKRLGLNAENWFIVKDNSFELVIQHKDTGTIRELKRKDV